ncbi:CsbD family protein [Merismopedia glauca]|uniref:CsbD family protein n=1 Tax=Merismopedia glauca CCAP 1448/3 TaxID=1296344 RepID=A0A2T1C326_9CYAN|nr:CsbD family protein [Merismopedia glauca]PSB02662.1 hypothetical protein C7B64_12175 [Merismopedia glauca CCAP 1448/3]
MNKKIKSLLLSVVSYCLAFLVAWSGAVLPSNSVAQAAPFSNSNDLISTKPLGTKAVENAKAQVKNDTDADSVAPSDISDNIEGKGLPEVRTDDIGKQDPVAVKRRAKELADRNQQQIEGTRKEIQGKAKQAAGNVKSAAEDATSKVEETKDNAVDAVKDFFKR